MDLALGVLGQVQGELQQDDRGDRHRKGDEEVPAPAEGISDDAAEQRSADSTDRHHGTEQAGVLAAVTGADDVRHDDLAQCREAAGTQALEHAEDDERAGVLGETGQCRTEYKDAQGKLDEQLAG